MGKKGNFLLGAGLGLGLGMLFAPQSGDKTRKELKNKLNELLEKVKTIDTEEVVNNISNKINELKEELAELDKEKAGAMVKQKAEDIKKKADELVKMAIDKGTPAVQKAAKEVRNATADFLSNMAGKIATEKKETKKIKTKSAK